MRHGLKLAMLSAIALSAASYAASAHPAVLESAIAGQTPAPIVKAGCYYGECEEHLYRRRCWHCYERGYERGYDRGYDRGFDRGFDHSRYYSHYRWGSYQRWWRPWYCCGSSGWGD